MLAPSNVWVRWIADEPSRSEAAQVVGRDGGREFHRAADMIVEFVQTWEQSCVDRGVEHVARLG